MPNPQNVHADMSPSLSLITPIDERASFSPFLFLESYIQGQGIAWGPGATLMTSSTLFAMRLYSDEFQSAQVGADEDSIIFEIQFYSPFLKGVSAKNDLLG